MAKIIALNRRRLTLTLGVVFLCLIGIAGVSAWKNNHTAVNKSLIPEVKMLGVNVEPAGPTKDVTYGSVTLKGSQIIPAKIFDLTVTLQNTTAQKMMNIPVELEVALVGDEAQKVTKMGNIEALEPGKTAKVIFHQIKALGDAQGKNPTAGLHQITVRIKSNPAGGINQTTAANFRFNVDSTVKVPAAAK